MYPHASLSGEIHWYSPVDNPTAKLIPVTSHNAEANEAAANSSKEKRNDNVCNS